MTTTKLIGLDQRAYRGAPKAPTKSFPLGLDNHTLRENTSKWNFKTKKVRRQEIIDRL